MPVHPMPLRARRIYRRCPRPTRRLAWLGALALLLLALSSCDATVFQLSAYASAGPATLELIYEPPQTVKVSGDLHWPLVKAYSGLIEAGIGVGFEHTLMEAAATPYALYVVTATEDGRTLQERYDIGTEFVVDLPSNADVSVRGLTNGTVVVRVEPLLVEESPASSAADIVRRGGGSTSDRSELARSDARKQELDVGRTGTIPAVVTSGPVELAVRFVSTVTVSPGRCRITYTLIGSGGNGDYTFYHDAVSPRADHLVGSTGHGGRLEYVLEKPAGIVGDPFSILVVSGEHQMRIDYWIQPHETACD